MYYCAQMPNTFTQKLFRWYSLNKRNLPWLGSNNPYLVWLSEIILQQTRVEQGMAYYLKFCKKYPTVKKFALAKEDEVLKMWEGLGYYSRARNMISTAKQIENELNGVFPDSYEGLIQLKGIGKYTAHAILSYAYNKPFAVVDGNVLRTLSRYYAISEPIDTPTGKSLIQQKADKLLDKENPAVFNQAMMDFGSLVCKPKNPDCANCPLSTNCKANQQGQPTLYPIKSKKINRQTRYFNFIILHDNKSVIIIQRNTNDIWKGLYQFPLIITEKPCDSKTLSDMKAFLNLGIINPKTVIETNVFTQQLTHQKLICKFFIYELKSLKKLTIENAIKIDFNNLNKYAFPGVIRTFLQNNMYF